LRDSIRNMVLNPQNNNFVMVKLGVETLHATSLLFYFKVLLFVIFLFILAPNAETLDINGDSLEVRLLIIGQGDPVYSLFGHTGIAIKNTVNGRDVF